MTPISALDDAARGQAPKCSAHGLKRHSNVFTNVRPVHREIYLGRESTSGGLKLLQHLKEHRHFRKSISPSKKKGVTLCLTEFVDELTDNVEV
jgi:hypothetical protein